MCVWGGQRGSWDTSQAPSISHRSAWSGHPAASFLMVQILGLGAAGMSQAIGFLQLHETPWSTSQLLASNPAPPAQSSGLTP